MWFTARIRPAAAQTGVLQRRLASVVQVAPLKESPRHLSMYDPKTNKWTLISTCFATHHLYSIRRTRPALTSAGGPGSGVVGWLNTKLLLETGDEAKAQGWTPIVVDTTATAFATTVTALARCFLRRDAEHGGRFGVGQSMGIGFARMDQPGYLMRIVPGPIRPRLR